MLHVRELWLLDNFGEGNAEGGEMKPAQCLCGFYAESRFYVDTFRTIIHSLEKPNKFALLTGGQAPPSSRRFGRNLDRVSAGIDDAGGDAEHLRAGTCREQHRREQSDDWIFSQRPQRKWQRGQKEGCEHKC